MTIGGLRHTGILKSHRHLLRRTHWLIFMYGLARKILEKFHLLTQVPRGGRRLIPLLYTSHKCTIRNLASLSDTWSKSDVPTDIRKNFEVPGGLGTTNAKLVYCITIVWVDPIKLIGSRQVRVPARCEWRAGPPNIILISCNHHRRLDEQIRSSNISLDPRKKCYEFTEILQKRLEASRYIVYASLPGRLQFAIPFRLPFQTLTKPSSIAISSSIHL